MSVDKSLKLQNQLARPRSVLSRAERIAILKDEGRWEEGDSVFSLPKVRVRVAKRRHKAAAKPEEAAEAAVATAEGAVEEGAAPAAEAPADTGKKAGKKGDKK